MMYFGDYANSKVAGRMLIAGDDIFLTGAVSADLLRIITRLEDFTMRGSLSTLLGEYLEPDPVIYKAGHETSYHRDIDEE